MKKFFFVLALAIPALSLSAQNGMTFDIATGETTVSMVGASGMPYYPLLKTVVDDEIEHERFAGAVPLLLVGQSRASRNILVNRVLGVENIISFRGGMFNELEFAASFNYPVVFSPEAVWLLINQAFSRHLAANPEKAKEWFGKDPHDVFTVTAPEGFRLADVRPEPYMNDNGVIPKELKPEYARLSAEGLDAEVWENHIFPQLRGQLEERLGAELAAILTDPFPTTSPADLAAFYAPWGKREVYRFPHKGITRIWISSGGGAIRRVPRVTLATRRSQPNPWNQLLSRARALAKYDFEWWVDELVPVLVQFAESARGRVNTKFWKDMLHFRGMPGGHNYEYVYNGPNGRKVLIYTMLSEVRYSSYTGWILKFYPYNNRNERNSMKAMPLAGTTDGLPLETFTADMRFVEPERGDTTMLELWAGNMGFGVPEGVDDEKTTLQYSVAPYIGWMVRKKDDRINSLKNYFIGKQRNERESFNLEFSFDGTIPQPIPQMPYIEQLDIYLDTTVRLLPAGLEKIPIKRIVLHEKIEGIGELDESNLEELRRKLPDTDISIWVPEESNEEVYI